MKYLSLLFLITSTACIAACQSQPVKPELTNSALEPCPEPRPQICTMIYDPVCASFSDGHTETKASNCTACGDSAVRGYTYGACRE